MGNLQSKINLWKDLTTHPSPNWLGKPPPKGQSEWGRLSSPRYSERGTSTTGAGGDFRKPFSMVVISMGQWIQILTLL